MNIKKDGVKTRPRTCPSLSPRRSKAFRRRVQHASSSSPFPACSSCSPSSCSYSVAAAAAAAAGPGRDRQMLRAVALLAPVLRVKGQDMISINQSPRRLVGNPLSPNPPSLPPSPPLISWHTPILLPSLPPSLPPSLTLGRGCSQLACRGLAPWLLLMRCCCCCCC